MRRTTVLGALLVATWVALAPAQVGAQPTYEPADPALPLPLWHSHPESGGLYTHADFVFYRQTNPIDGQIIAVRGFVAVDEQILGPGTAGVFVGSGRPALDAQQVSGPNSYQPGGRLGIGWRFSNGSTLSANFLRLTEAKYTAAATLFPAGLQVGQDFEESFLFSPVFNFPNEYTGPRLDVRASRPVRGVPLGNAQALRIIGVFVPGTPVFPSDTTIPTFVRVNEVTLNAPGATAGIWNAAELMTLSFVQRYQDFDITYRVPVYENETYRLSGKVGPRVTWIWERFSWRTTDLNEDGNAGPVDTALYSNVISNYMYGTFIGCEQECYLGHGFAAVLDLKASAYMDIVKTRVKYERGDKYTSPANKRAKREFNIVPQLEASLNLAWYPFEGIQFQAGYDLMAFFNTTSSQRPVSFDYSGLDPEFSQSVIRFFDGFHAGIALVF